MRILPQLHHDVDVDDGGAMDADEAAGLERVVERAEQLTVQVHRPVARVQLHVHAVGLNRADLFDRQQPDAMGSPRNRAGSEVRSERRVIALCLTLSCTRPWGRVSGRRRKTRETTVRDG